MCVVKKKIKKMIQENYRSNCLENVKYFKYLRLTLDANGRCIPAMQELA